MAFARNESVKHPTPTVVMQGQDPLYGTSVPTIAPATSRATYINTTTGKIYVYNGSSWQLLN